MRIVPDTNVLIASLISHGLCHELLEYCFLNHILFTSEFVLGEVREKLIEKFEYSIETADEAVALFRSRMQIAEPSALSYQVSRDPDDDNILAAAVAGKCDFIITGDKDLLVLKHFEGIKILSPKEFSVVERIE